MLLILRNSLLLCCFCYASISFSDDLYPIATISGSRLPQNYNDSGISVTVIEAEMIKRSSARRIPDILRLIPGFTMAQWNSQLPLMSVHGLADSYNKRINVLVDGKSMFITSVMSTQLIDIPVALQDIERIEVYRSPTTVAFGAGSFFSTVNIITTHPSQEPSFSTSTRLGSHNIQDYTIQTAHRGAAFDYSLTGTLTRNSDMYAKDGRILEEFNEQLLRGKFSYQFDNGDYLLVQAGYAWATYDISPYYFADKTRIFEQVKYEHNFSEGHYLTSQLHLKQFHYTNRGSFGITPAEELIAINPSSSVYSGELEIRDTVLLAESKFTVGLTSEYTASKTPVMYTRDFTPNQLEDSALQQFVLLEHSLSPKILITLGAAHDQSTLAGSAVTTQASVSYKYSNYHQFRLSSSSGIRNPSLIERYASIYGPVMTDPSRIVNLLDAPDHDFSHPESIHSYDLSHLYHDKALSTEFRIYYQRISHLLALAYGLDNNLEYSSVNYPIYAYGEEFTFRYIHPDWDFFFSASQMNVDSSNSDNDFYTISSLIQAAPLKEENSAPSYTLATLATRHFHDPDYDVTLLYNQFGSFHWSESTSTDGISRLDINITKCFSPSSFAICGKIMAQNILNEDEGYLSERGAGRGYYIELTAEF